ncbi:hypothetical protein EVAR_61831_1 [Eumeta japonica]|uniref:Uncharacterized protein n=1 Tax=Eumeta variegata TaxID=151549 RepID=A0A4C1YSZ2_EUMVA|nr:hypothetical protein EVAR_61831_1 [Eumeta japonica]
MRYACRGGARALHGAYTLHDGVKLHRPPCASVVVLQFSSCGRDSASVPGPRRVVVLQPTNETTTFAVTRYPPGPAARTGARSRAEVRRLRALRGARGARGRRPHSHPLIFYRGLLQSAKWRARGSAH